MDFVKPKKWESFTGNRDALVVITRFYQVEKYLSLTTTGNPQLALNESAKVGYASTILYGNVARWRNMLVQ